MRAMPSCQHANDGTQYQRIIKINQSLYMQFRSDAFVQNNRVFPRVSRSLASITHDGD